MDGRLNAHCDKALNDGNTVFVSNAGASVLGVKGTITQAIQHFGVNEIILLTHSDCGNNKEIALEIGRNEMRLGKVFYDTHVKPFEKRAFEDNSDLDEMNPHVQLEAAKRLFPGVRRISSELIDLKKISIPAGGGDHSLIIANPSKRKFSAMARAVGKDVSDCYVALGYGSEILPDMLLATKVMGIRHLHFLEQAGDDKRDLKLRMEKAKNILRTNDELNWMLADGSMTLEYVRLARA